MRTAAVASKKDVRDLLDVLEVEMGVRQRVGDFVAEFVKSFGLPLTVSSMTRDGRFEPRASHAEQKSNSRNRVSVFGE